MVRSFNEGKTLTLLIVLLSITMLLGVAGCDGDNGAAPPPEEGDSQEDEAPQDDAEQILVIGEQINLIDLSDDPAS